MSRRYLLIALLILGSGSWTIAADEAPVSLVLAPVFSGPSYGGPSAPPATLGPIEPAPTAVTTPATVHVSQGQLTATPEMWLYEQEMRRYEDPKTAVRRKAEQRSQARLDRIQAMKWFGLSNSRPVASAVPFMAGTYSPAWTGNHADPNRWVGSGGAPVIILGQ